MTEREMNIFANHAKGKRGYEVFWEQAKTEWVRAAVLVKSHFWARKLDSFRGELGEYTAVELDTCLIASFL